MILKELDGDDQAELISEIHEAAQDVRSLVECDPATAGGVMTTEALVFQEAAPVRDVFDQITPGEVDFERCRGRHP